MLCAHDAAPTSPSSSPVTTVVTIVTMTNGFRCNHTHLQRDSAFFAARQLSNLQTDGSDAMRAFHHDLHRQQKAIDQKKRTEVEHECKVMRVRQVTEAS